jgi:hypothetical protein
VVHIHNRVLFSHTEKWNYTIFRKIDGTEIIRLIETSQTQKETWHVFYHMKKRNVKKRWKWM